MAGKLSLEEGASIYKPPFFCGLNYKFWEAGMKIFIESIGQRIWDSIQNGPYISKFKKEILSLQNLCPNGQMMNVSWLNLISLLKTLQPALDTNQFFRISKCKTAKEMWETLKAAHEPKEAMTKGQARRKRRQNKKSLNLCFMARKEDDSSSVSSSNSENYGQLLQAFQETHEEANRLALLNNRLKEKNSWLENRVKTLEEDLEHSKMDFENLEIIYKKLLLQVRYSSL